MKTENENKTPGRGQVERLVRCRRYTDTERMDWLEKNAADAICDTVFDDGEHHWHIEHARGLNEPSGATVRSAIDAAMESASNAASERPLADNEQERNTR